MLIHHLLVTRLPAGNIIREHGAEQTRRKQMKRQSDAGASGASASRAGWAGPRAVKTRCHVVVRWRRLAWPCVFGISLPGHHCKLDPACLGFLPSRYTAGPTLPAPPQTEEYLSKVSQREEEEAEEEEGREREKKIPDVGKFSTFW